MCGHGCGGVSVDGCWRSVRVCGHGCGGVRVCGHGCGGVSVDGCWRSVRVCGLGRLLYNCKTVTVGAMVVTDLEGDVRTSALPQLQHRGGPDPAPLVEDHQRRDGQRPAQGGERMGVGEHPLILLLLQSVGATYGGMVNTSAFLAFHQCYCAGSSLTWGWNLQALVCGIF